MFMTFPDGLEIVPLNVAFGRVVEKMLLRSLQDIQQSGELAWLRGQAQHLALHQPG
jgi:hypothetical protein